MRAMMFILLALTFVLSSMSQAQARNTACSGKMGGVSHCSKEGKFVCKNGKISQSKQVCR